MTDEPNKLSDRARGSRLRRLKRIEKANRLRSWRARSDRAFRPAAVAAWAVVIALNVDWHLWPTVALIPMVYLDQMGRGGLASRWNARLDRQLALYRPLDEQAFAALQRQARNSEALSVFAVEAWIAQERLAVRRPGPPGRSWKFAAETERAGQDRKGRE